MRGAHGGLFNQVRDDVLLETVRGNLRPRHVVKITLSMWGGPPTRGRKRATRAALKEEKG